MCLVKSMAKSTQFPRASHLCLILKLFRFVYKMYQRASFVISSSESLVSTEEMAQISSNTCVVLSGLQVALMGLMPFQVGHHLSA